MRSRRALSNSLTERLGTRAGFFVLGSHFSSGRLVADIASAYPAVLDQSLADLTWRSSFAANWNVIRVTYKRQWVAYFSAFFPLRFWRTARGSL